MRGRAQVAKLLPALVWAFALFFLTPGLDLYAAPQNRTQTSADARQSKSLQLNERGAAAVNAKDFSGAEQLFRQALAVDPYNLTAVFNLAGMYLSNQKEESAKQLLEDYTKRYPKDAGLYARLGDTYFTLKKLQEAARAYETVLKLNPSYPK
ncbi:MAG: tetratricopeptide repeat protein, partial [Deltaproteobacteria bacterium]|nr:tetratricopeptide repeat protein [Deltaproteobacteria bacterium]